MRRAAAARMMTEQGPNYSNSPRVIQQPAEMQELVRQMQRAGKQVGLVPTMGALHEGHLSLVRRSVGQCDATVVTIFVNPTQFGPQEDFDRYPRTFASDLEKLADESTDLVFVPANELIYPDEFSTYVEAPAVGDRLEGNCRPGHFRGVTTIVMKLFQLVPADVAFFGQKDFQQCLVIQHMVRDLNVPICVEICPTVREADGLAMSSRNQYLSAAQRQQGLALSRSLGRAAEMFRQGETDSKVIRVQMRQILSDAGITQVDYVALVDPCTLRDVETVEPGTMALIAAHVGKTRLIDNRRIG